MSAHYRRLIPAGRNVDADWLTIEASIIQGSALRHGDDVRKLVWTIRRDASNLWSLDAEVCR